MLKLKDNTFEPTGGGCSGSTASLCNDVKSLISWVDFSAEKKKRLSQNEEDERLQSLLLSLFDETCWEQVWRFNWDHRSVVDVWVGAGGLNYSFNYSWVVCSIVHMMTDQWWQEVIRNLQVNIAWPLTLCCFLDPQTLHWNIWQRQKQTSNLS